MQPRLFYKHLCNLLTNLLEWKYLSVGSPLWCRNCLAVNQKPGWLVGWSGTMDWVIFPCSDCSMDPYLQHTNSNFKLQIPEFGFWNLTSLYTLTHNQLVADPPQANSVTSLNPPICNPLLFKCHDFWTKHEIKNILWFGGQDFFSSSSNVRSKDT